MPVTVHKQAPTTPVIRVELQASGEPSTLLARRYNVTLSTVYASGRCVWTRQGQRIFLSYENAIHDLHLLMLALFASLPAPLLSDRER